MLYILTLILTKKQQFIKCEWEKLDKLTLKIKLIIFFSDQINLKDFAASMLKIDKKKLQRD